MIHQNLIKSSLVILAACQFYTNPIYLAEDNKATNADGKEQAEPGTYPHAKEKAKEAANATKEAASDVYQASKDKASDAYDAAKEKAGNIKDATVDAVKTATVATKDATVGTYEALKNKLASLVTITRVDMVTLHDEYKEVFLKEQEKDLDLNRIFEARYRLARKKIEPIQPRVDASLKKFETTREQENKNIGNKDDVAKSRKESQTELRTELNEITTIYAAELEHARKSVEMLRKKAEKTNQPLKVVVEEEIQVLQKSL